MICFIAPHSGSTSLPVVFNLILPPVSSCFLPFFANVFVAVLLKAFLDLTAFCPICFISVSMDNAQWERSYLYIYVYIYI